MIRLMAMIIIVSFILSGLLSLSKNISDTNIDNRNQGLINTDANHNNKIKSLGNKFNFIVNNYATLSHTESVVKK